MGKVWTSIKESALMRHCPSFNKSILYKIIIKNLRGSGTGFKVGLNELLLGLSWEDVSPK